MLFINLFCDGTCGDGLVAKKLLVGCVGVTFVFVLFYAFFGNFAYRSPIYGMSFLVCGGCRILGVCGAGVVLMVVGLFVGKIRRELVGRL